MHFYFFMLLYCNMKKVSIVVPIFNSQAYLKNMLNCLSKQTYPKEYLEIILVDDGSKDNSNAICKDYCKKCSNFILIEQENKGVSSARNKGLTVATGDYITFLDSDDSCDKTYVEVMVNGLEKTGADLICCGIIEKENNKIEVYGYNEDKVFPITDEQSYVDFFNAYWLPVVWNKLYKRSLITEKFDECLLYDEDTVFNLNYLKNVKNIVCIKEKLYCYHKWGKQDSLSNLGEKDIFEKSKVTNKYRINISKQIFKTKQAVFVACRKIIKAIFQEVKSNYNLKMNKNEILRIAEKRLKDQEVIKSFSYFSVIYDCDDVIEKIFKTKNLELLYDCAINGFKNHIK